MQIYFKMRDVVNGGKKVLDLGRWCILTGVSAFEIQHGVGKDRELSCVVLGFESKGIIIVTFLKHRISPRAVTDLTRCPPVPPSHVVGSVASHLVK